MEFGLFGLKALEFIINPIENDARINILEGSVRSGKTVSMIPKWINYIKEGPKGLLIITGVSKETIYDNVLQDLFDTVGEKNYSYNSQTGVIKMYGRKIKVIGAKDEGSEKYIRGKTLAGAYCDELTLMPEKFFKQLLNRLSIKGAKLYGTTNPDSPYHYLYTEYITDAEKLESGMVKVYHFNLEDNPNLDDEYITFIKSAYRGLWYQRMILGLWVLAEGVIYDMFDKTKNVVVTVNRKYVERYVSIDYGTLNPTTFGMFSKEITGQWYKEKEYHYSGREKKLQKTDEEYADDLAKFVDGDKKIEIIVDPSAASFIATLRKRGFKVRKANNDVLDGIRNTAAVIQNKIILFNDCNTNTFKEFETYIWDEKASLRGEDKPLKENDHHMDNLRYFCNTILQFNQEPYDKKVYNKGKGIVKNTNPYKKGGTIF